MAEVHHAPEAQRRRLRADQAGGGAALGVPKDVFAERDPPSEYLRKNSGKKNAQVRMELVDAIGVVNRDCGLDYDNWIRAKLLYFI